MQIKLSLKQESELLAWIAPITQAEVDAECEPAGYLLEIDFGGPYGASATAVKGKSRLELGDVEVVLEAQR